MPGRQYNVTTYTYSFNGKRDDKEAEYGWQDYGMREYDHRAARFISADPLTKRYPWYSPYQYSGDKPIWKIDLDGLEEYDLDEELYEREEFISRLKGVELSRLLKTPSEEELARIRMQQEDAEKDPRGSLRRAVEWLKNYRESALNALQNSYGGNPLSKAVYEFNNRQFQLEINKANAKAFENLITTQLRNQTNAEVVNQVTLVVNGQLDGRNVSVRIRIDNITSTNGVLDLIEAKYSVDQLSGSNYIKSLTPNQKVAFQIFTSGENFEIIVRGNKAEGIGLPSGTDIKGKIKDIKVLSNKPDNQNANEIKNINLQKKSE